MTLDFEKYLAYTRALELSVPQQKEMIELVWNFIQSQIEQEFGMHPVQLCGENQKRHTHPKQCQIDSKKIPQLPFNRLNEDK